MCIGAKLDFSKNTEIVKVLLTHPGLTFTIFIEVRSTHLFEDIDEPMLADHSSLVVTQRYIDRDREAWRTNVDLVCPNG